MAEADVEGPRAVSDPGPGPERGRGPWVRGMACVALIPLIGFIGQSGRSLWGEWSSLRREQARERESAIVGYVDILPNPNYASRPDDWLHDEGDESLLWAGWDGAKHRWFRIGLGEFKGWPLSYPIGRDAIRAIDHPILEAEGGACWSRIPPEARVVGFGEGTHAIAYPVKVLNKVEVVNDRVADRAVLVVLNPDVDPISIFESSLDGRRVTLGHSGYFAGKRPLLYDRRTLSLWLEREGAMVAVAGPRKGAALRRIARVDPVSWGEWLAGHPAGRLVVGADRSKAMPAD